ncbi:ribokinase [Tessaracoccus caeni]|uniref:ribokinase n=1 Tax=Tessaracoccus caeni TaxID=3031239 RepID=UPI0023DCC6BF|nr:ribokinase [Tessaracoccus caeni]MDF1489548.1 ribokinase [Tessaracoccus caeni]
MSVVVVGSVNADLHLRLARHPRPGETLLASGGTLSPGGKGANQACASALAGAPTVLLGAVGADGAKEAALRLLKDGGVDISRLAVIADQPTGLAVVTVDAEGENTVVVVPGANTLVGTASVEAWEPLIADATVLVLQGEIPATSSARAADLASGQVVVNLAPVISMPASLLRRADPLVVNEHEGEEALQQLGGETISEPREILEGLLAQGVPSVVMTLGAAGALVGDASGISSIPSPTVTPVDTVGAGDAFVGALAARLAAGDSLVISAGYAARFAAYTVQFDGAQSSYPAPGTPLPEVS